jgi:hypothetical protein
MTVGPASITPSMRPSSRPDQLGIGGRFAAGGFALGATRGAPTCRMSS